MCMHGECLVGKLHGGVGRYGTVAYFTGGHLVLGGQYILSGRTELPRKCVPMHMQTQFSGGNIFLRHWDSNSHRKNFRDRKHAFLGICVRGNNKLEETRIPATLHGNTGSQPYSNRSCASVRKHNYAIHK